VDDAAAFLVLFETPYVLEKQVLLAR